MMIVYPSYWEKQYDKIKVASAHKAIDIGQIVQILGDILIQCGVKHLAYSGGLDSTIMLHLMTQIFGKVFTYTISCREDHPDILFARRGCKIYGSIHREFVVQPTSKDSDKLEGDNAVRQFFGSVSNSTDEIICCDGIDEYMCGYYDHQVSAPEQIYIYYLSRLLPDHLVPLNFNSGGVRIFLPYLDNRIIEISENIELSAKVDSVSRKKVMINIAKYLGIEEGFINRNKYGFSDAFLKRNK